MSELPGGIEPARVPEPRESALGVLLRRGPAGAWQILLGRRSRKARFLPGNLAFPGGRMEPEDRPGEPGSWRRCASRELAEETGIAVDPLDWMDGGERSTPPIFPVRYRTAFLVWDVGAGDGPPPPPASTENETLVWIDPEDGVRRFMAGEILVPPPVLAVLRSLASSTPANLTEAAEQIRALNRAEEEAPRIEFVPGIWMVPMHTDTLPPATHTNAWIPAGERFVVVDPGTDRPAELVRLQAVIRRLQQATPSRPAGVFLTHHHQDHVGGAAQLARALGVPVYAHPSAPVPLQAEPLRDGHPFDLGGLTLVPVLTPGHAPGHLAFHVPERHVLISGDLVSALSTMVIPPEPGAMDRYLDSLARASSLGARRLLPSHGPPVPAGILEKTAKHRLDREARVLAALRSGYRRLRDIAAEAYADSPGAVPFLARQQTLAHLLRLEGAGRASRDGTEDWQMISS